MTRPLMPAISSGALVVISPITLMDWLTGSTRPPRRAAFFAWPPPQQPAHLRPPLAIDVGQRRLRCCSRALLQQDQTSGTVAECRIFSYGFASDFDGDRRRPKSSGRSATADGAALARRTRGSVRGCWLARRRGLLLLRPEQGAGWQIAALPDNNWAFTRRNAAQPTQESV